MFNIELPLDILTDDAIAKKVAGFRLFKADTVINIQVNGNPFWQGRLIICFVPQAQEPQVYPGVRGRSLCSISQLPHVELDVSCDTEATLRIPWINPQPYFDLHNLEGHIGRVYVYVYSPLDGVSVTSATVNAYAHFENMELEGPCYFAEMDSEVFSGPLKVKRKNRSEVESGKPISSTLSAISKGFANFARIPLLSSFAGTASWVTGAAAMAASAFGYSKPLYEQPTNRVYQHYMPNMANSDGTDFCASLALSASNKVDILPGFAGTNTDECSLTYLCSRPAFVSTTSWDDTQAVGTVLIAKALQPGVFKDTYTVTPNQYVDTAPLAFFASMFYYWRGSIRLTFKFVKTDKHSGRVIITYNPTNYAPAFNLNSYVMKEVVDIREMSEISLLFPFISARQFLPTNTLDDSAANNPMGYVQIFVETKLTHPDNVASSIEIITEVSAGPDFELAGPRQMAYTTPYMKASWLTAEMDSSVFPKKVDECDNVASHVIAGSPAQPLGLEVAQYVVGEKVNSVLQLMKRYTHLTSSEIVAAISHINYRVFTIFWRQLGETTNYPTGDYYGMIAPCFAYVRGGMRFLIVLEQSTQSRNINYRIKLDDGATTPVVGTANTLNVYATQVFGTPNVQTGSVVVPAYPALDTRLVRPTTYNSFEPVDQWGSPVVVLANIQDDASTSPKWYRAVSDDCSLGMFLGTPPIQVADL